MFIKTDIYRKIEIDFKDNLQAVIEQIEILDAEANGLLSDRLLRAMVFVANGNIERLKQIIKLARIDYRDVLWQAEYDANEKQIHDFNKSFDDLKLLDK